MSGVDPTAFLLGELAPEEEAEALRRIEEDPAFRAEVERLRPVVAALEALPGDAWDLPEPPPLRHPDAVPAAEPRPARSPRAGRAPWWRRAMVPMPAFGLATVIALACGVGIGALVVGGGDAPSAPRQVADVRLAAFGDTPVAAGGDARIMAGQELTLQVHDLAPSDGGSFYTAWLLGEDGKTVSLGSFRVPSSGAATVRLPLPVSPSRFDYVDVSVEPDDGNPAHSGHSVLRGRTA
ncbi:MAG: anti-sigma factor [Thermoleophilia bacterium]